MKFLKSMMLVGLGVGGTVVYQKYNKKAMKELDKFMNKTFKKIEDDLDEM